MKILFCHDGSKTAEDAVRFGALIAAACQAETSILGITEKDGQGELLLEALPRAQAILKEHRLTAELILKPGRLVPEIVQRAREVHFDLVVIGVGRKRIAGLGWKSARGYQIIERIEPPVLLVGRARPALRRMLVCTSGRPQANKIVEVAAELAHKLGAFVTLIHVLPEPPAIYADLVAREADPGLILASSSKLGRALRRQRELLEVRGVPLEFRLRQGMVVPEVLKELVEGDHDLVVCGAAPAEDKLRDYVLGDVTREIVNLSQSPVLVVRAALEPSPQRLRERIRRLFRLRQTVSNAAGG